MKEARLCFEQHSPEYLGIPSNPEEMPELLQKLADEIRKLPREDQAKFRDVIVSLLQDRTTMQRLNTVVDNQLGSGRNRRIRPMSQAERQRAYEMSDNALRQGIGPDIERGRRMARSTRDRVSQVDPEFADVIPANPQDLTAVFYGRGLVSPGAVRAARSNGRSVRGARNKGPGVPGYRWKTPEDIVRHEMEDLDRDQDLVAMPEDRARRRWDQAGNLYKNYTAVMNEHMRQREAMKPKRSPSVDAYDARINMFRRRGYPVIQTGPYSTFIDRRRDLKANGNRGYNTASRDYRSLVDNHIDRLGGDKYLREQTQLRNMYTRRLESNLPRMRAEYATYKNRYNDHPQFGPSFRRVSEIIDRNGKRDYGKLTWFRHQTEAMRAGEQAESLMQENREKNFKDGALHTESLDVSRGFAADKYSAIQIRKEGSTKVLTYRPNVVERFSDAGSPDLLFDWKIDFQHNYYRLSSSRVGEEGKQILKGIDIRFAEPGTYYIGSKKIIVGLNSVYDDSSLSPSAADSIPRVPVPETVPSTDPGSPLKPNPEKKKSAPSSEFRDYFEPDPEPKRKPQ